MHWPKVTDPEGEPLWASQNPFPENMVVDTYGGRIHIEWDSEAPITPMVQMKFGWIRGWPAPKKVVAGS